VPKRGLVKIILLAVVLVCVAVVVTATIDGSDNGADMPAGTAFNRFVTAGGPVVWFVLLPMSVAVLSLAVQHCLNIRRKKLVPEGIGTEIITLLRAFGIERTRRRLADNADFVSVAVTRAFSRGNAKFSPGQPESLLADALAEQVQQLLRKIEWADIIGNVAPMVGLFGTVFGMIKMFNSIVTAGGQPQPAHLAEGISVALVTTLWGLLVAIPALVIHGIFRNRIETLASEAARQAEAVLQEITSGFENRKNANIFYPKEQNKSREKRRKIIATT